MLLSVRCWQALALVLLVALSWWWLVAWPVAGQVL
jgi:hypothetical protein